MTFDYVKFFTHKIYLFNGLLFTHMFVKVPIFTTFYTVASPIRLYRGKYKKRRICLYVYLYVYVYVYVIVMFMDDTFEGVPNIIVAFAFASS